MPDLIRHPSWRTNTPPWIAGQARNDKTEGINMIRDQETLTQLLDAVNRFVRERLVPNEALVAETDEIPADIVREMKELGLFGCPSSTAAWASPWKKKSW
jgi:alkylation response protein AidB-like acyl-CoA dehydrogenase